MLSSVLDAFVDDDEEEGGSSKTNVTLANGSFCGGRSSNSASAMDGADDNNVTSGISPAANYTVGSRFASPPRRKRTDLVRLQMRCPTIVGAAVSETTATEDENDKDQQSPAQSLFVFPLPKASAEGVTRPIHTNTVAAYHVLFTNDPSSGGLDDNRSRSIDTSIPRDNNTSSSVGLRLKTESEGSLSCGPPSSTATPASRANALADSNRASGRSAVHYGTEAEGYMRGAAAAATEGTVTRYSAIVKEEDGEKQKENNSLATTLGPDGVPLLKYEKGPFHVAEEAPMKEFRFIQQQPPTFASVDETNTKAASSEKGRGQHRGKTLLSMLPEPQHQQLEAVMAFSSSFVRSLKQRQATRESSSSSNVSNSSQAIGSATEADSHARNASSAGKEERANGSSSRPTGRSSSNSGTTSSSSSKTEASSWGNKDFMSRSEIADSSASENMATVIQADEKKAKHRGKEARDSALSSLFSAYDDDEDETEENASPNAVGGTEKKLTHFERETTKTEHEMPAASEDDEGNKTETRVATTPTTSRLPLLGISFDAADEKCEPNDSKNSKSSGSRICFGMNLDPLVPGTEAAGESASTADTANLHNAGSLTSEGEAYVNVWGDSETTGAEFVGAQGPVIDAAGMGPATQQLHSEQSSQLRAAGMSLNEYRELQSATLKDVSGETLRDPDWQLNYQLHGTPAHAKRTKLNISTNVWSVKDKGIVQTVEPRAMQKRKHQINWLAAEAAEKELEMWEMMAKSRQNKYNTAMKYGW